MKITRKTRKDPDCVVTASLIRAGENGAVFRNGDAASLAGAIEAIARNPYRVKTGIPFECTERGNLEMLEAVYRSATSHCGGASDAPKGRP